MAKTISQDMVLEALKAVVLDGKTIDLTPQVSGVMIKDGNVGFSLEIAPEDTESAMPLRRAAEKAVQAIPNVLSATAMLTAHKEAPPQTNQPNQTERAMHQPARHIIAIASGKGGVGKSTTAINLALALKQSGLSVGVLDADIYGPSLPRLTGLTVKPQAKDNKLIPLDAFGMRVMSIGFLVEEAAPTIWRGPMVMSALEQMLRDVDWGELDVLIIDMPPGTGDAQLTLSQRVKLAGAVIVSTPQDLALIDARKGLNMFLKVGVPVLGLIENMSSFICPSCGAETPIFGHGGAEAEAKRLKVNFLGHIPLEMEIRTSSDDGTPIVISKPSSPHAKIYQDIASKMMQHLPEHERTPPSITME